MAYLSEDPGLAEVYQESLTLEGRRAGRIQISNGGGGDPTWRGDGRELYYLSWEGKLMAVDIRPDFTAGTPKELFSLSRLMGSTIYRPHRFAVTRDGRRFLIATAPERKIAPLTVIINWQNSFAISEPLA